MWRFLIPLLAFASFSAADFKEASNGIQQLAFSIYKESISEKGDILISPFSAETILALTFMGAREETATEMGQVLGLSQETAAESFQEVLSGVNKSSDISVNSANKIYVKPDITLQDEFKQIATNSFLAEIENINFTDSAFSCDTVNKWVESKTNNKIKNILTPDLLDPDTTMILVNALYFYGKWPECFESYKHVEKEFHLDLENKIKLPIMWKTTDELTYGINSELDVTFIDHPYIDPDYVFTIILPNQINGLSTLENKITPAILKNSTVVQKSVHVTLPKFEIEHTIKLKSVLTKLGMVEAFNYTANFSGISEEAGHISEAVQKTFMKVDECGTEAAAATAVILTDRISEESSLVFNVDHPFMFMIRQRSTDVIFFIGRFTGQPKS